MNAADALFVGVYPTGLVYADRRRERSGDYERVAYLNYRTLRLQWAGSAPDDMRALVEASAATMQARKGQLFPISSCGQHVPLGMDAGPEPARVKRHEGWPFPAANDRTCWHEIREDHAIELRDCVPPDFTDSGGFYVGEAANHDPDGWPVHAFVIERAGRWFLREMRTERAVRLLLTADLDAALAGGA